MYNHQHVLSVIYFMLYWRLKGVYFTFYTIKIQRMQSMLKICVGSTTNTNICMYTCMVTTFIELNLAKVSGKEAVYKNAQNSVLFVAALKAWWVSIVVVPDMKACGLRCAHSLISFVMLIIFSVTTMAWFGYNLDWKIVLFVYLFYCFYLLFV